MVSQTLFVALFASLAISGCLGGPSVAVPAAYSVPYASSYSANVVNHAIAAPVAVAPARFAAAPLAAAPFARVAAPLAAAPLVARTAPLIAPAAAPYLAASPYFAAPYALPAAAAASFIAAK